jgi:organic radical activating enzyme
MKIDQVKNSRELIPLKWPRYEIPHLTIETNMICNIACRSCYNLHKNYVKPLAELKQEIVMAVQKRNLETITLLGGEPTLHPQLVEIIRYIKRKKLICQMLTNGIVFLRDKDDIMLDKLIRAGLNRILLHIDNGQRHIHPDIEAARDALFSKFEQKQIFFSLSMTIYKDDQGSIPDVIRHYSHYKYFDGILALLDRDVRALSSVNPASNCKPELDPEYLAIQHDLQIEPTAYIPASLDDKYISWLMYFYYINIKSGVTFAISPKVNRLFRKVHRWLTGHHVFALTVNPNFFMISFLLTCIIELLMHPGKMSALYNLMKQSSGLKALRFQYLCIQSGPVYNADKKEVQLCYHCPDATIRNGKLTPVCVADQINPLPGGWRPDQISQTLFKTVYQHLQEI